MSMTLSQCSRYLNFLCIYYFQNHRGWLLHLTKNYSNSKMFLTFFYLQVPRNCTIAHQQRIAPNPLSGIVTVTEVPRPSIPRPEITTYHTVPQELQSVYNSILCTRSESDEFEQCTRSQSESSHWKRLRHNRLTSSSFKNICARRKDHKLLAQRLITGKTLQTAAMSRGLELEPKAAEVYANNKGANCYPIGLVINPSCPHLATSPDRLIYDPNAPEDQKWGLLEIKCPMKTSYKDCDYLRNRANNNEFTLKKNHEYYYQITGQLGLTGFTWCDFMVFCVDDYLIERITFDENLFEEMKQKLDLFYVEHFLPCLKM